MLGAVFFEMMPEAQLEKNALFIALGFFLFYILEKLVMIHACGEEECVMHKMTWVSVMGMMSDNIVDGIGIAVGYFLNPMLGVFIAIAVIMHEVPQGLSTVLIMKNAGFGFRKTLAVLLGETLLYPVGAFISFAVPPAFYTAMIAFVAGDFLYIAGSDLLPHAHRKFNLRVVAAVLFGGIFLFALESLLH
jgi:zinc transporter ZupT